MAEFKIEKSTSFLAYGIDDNNTRFVTFQGSVDANGMPSNNYYISDNDVYRNNLKLFREYNTAFQDAVFTESDNKLQELAEEDADATTTTTTTTTTVK